MNKKLRFYILTALLSMGAIGFYSCAPIDKSPDSFEIKNEPYDLSFQQRFYPANKPDIKAYKNALKKVNLAKSNRNPVNGFDEEWTVQGPGSAGARINSVAVQEDNENVIYAGYSGGGIFKTTDGGVNWNPVFDEQPYLAIGDISIDPNSPNIVYAGTGDPNISGYPFIGDGIYKTIDGGQNWAYSGLAETGIISRVIVNPDNSNILFAGAMGLHYERNADRGVYRSLDGGESWEQVLFISDSTGVIDMSINPDNPNIIYAAGWDRIRTNSTSVVFGHGAKIYRSIDGGDTWTHLTNGLPEGINCRIGIDIFQSDPSILYAMYIGTDYQVAGIYKTTDGGDSWFPIPTAESDGLDDNAMGSQGWYLGKLRVHPTSPGQLFVLGVRLWKTGTDGALWVYGSLLTGPDAPHVDNHDIHVTNSGTVFMANDGGLYRQPFGSTNWEDIENIPATQIYRTSYNPHRPEYFYGGAQDNGTQHGVGGDLNNWSEILGADGFQPLFHPTDSLKVYAETQRGGIRMSLDGGSGFQFGTSGINNTDRKHWDMQYIMSPHDPNVLYTGTYRVYKSESNGLPSWNSISESLTNPVLVSPSFHTITSISESPITQGLLYVGTTDGRLWKSPDDGGNWIEITEGLPNRYITSVKASPDNSERLFVTHSGYRDGSYIPHVHRSDDAGENWIDISGDLPVVGVNDIYVMPLYNGTVLFAATDGGVFATLNGGVNWNFLGSNMPTIPVYDLDWHEQDNLLIAATFARSIQTFPLDSIGVTAVPPSSFAVSGSINTPENEPLSNVNLTYQNGVSTTDVDGIFDLANVPVDQDCEILPSKNLDHDNGVNTFDIVLLQKHILLIDTLEGPYKKIAADVNDNGQINIFDIIQMRRLILFFDTTFANNQSWRFVPEDYTFIDPENPTQEDFPEFFSCADVNSNQTDVNFLGIKVGDVNSSAQTTSTEELLLVSERSETTRLEVDDREFDKGEIFKVHFRNTNKMNVEGLQFGLHWDSDELEFLNLTSSALDDFSEKHYNSDKAKQGILLSSFSTGKATSIEPNTSIITITFQSLKSGKLSNHLSFSNNFIKSEVYQSDNNLKMSKFSLGIRFLDPFESKSTLEITPFPNPFDGYTTFFVNSPIKERLQITILDASGKPVKTFEQELTIGKNQIDLNLLDNLDSGVYLLSVKSKTKSIISKIVKF